MLNDLSAYWMPFTANRQFKAAPRLLAGASGMYYRMADGREILDGTAGLWCVNAGHCRAEIADAIARQARALDYATAFQMGHPQAFALAARLARLAPGDLDHVFYVNSGSEAVETALKIALAYHHARGETGQVPGGGRSPTHPEPGASPTRRPLHLLPHRAAEALPGQRAEWHLDRPAWWRRKAARMSDD